MATKPLSTITKLANLEHSKKQRIAKIAEGAISSSLAQ